MPYDIAGNLRPINFFQNIAAAQQQDKVNALNEREVGLRERELQAKTDAIAQAQKKAEQEQMVEHVRNGVGWLLSAPDDNEFSRRADQLAMDPMTQKLGITRDQITRENTARIAMQVGVKPQIPFEQTDEYKKLQLEQSGRKELENQRFGHEKTLAGMRRSNDPVTPKWEKADRVLPDGSTESGFVNVNSPNPTSTFIPLGSPKRPLKIAQGNQAAWDMYQRAREGLLSGLAGASTGPVVGRITPVTSAAQIAEGAVSAMAPVLKQIFRVAGEGTFTDRDQALLLDMVPTRKDLPEARIAKLENIDRIIKAKLGIDESGGSGDGTTIPFGSLNSGKTSSGWGIEKVE